MTPNQSFVFPPPPPPPPRATGPAQGYGGPSQSYPHSSGFPPQGHQPPGGRGRGRGRGDGFRGSRGSQGYRGRGHAGPGPNIYPSPASGAGAPTFGKNSHGTQSALWPTHPSSGLPLSSHAFYPQPVPAPPPHSFIPQGQLPHMTGPNAHNHTATPSYNPSFPVPNSETYFQAHGPVAEVQPPSHQPAVGEIRQQPALMGPPIRMGFEQQHPLNIQQSQHLQPSAQSAPFVSFSRKHVQATDTHSIPHAFNQHSSAPNLPGRFDSPPKSRRHGQSQQGQSRPFRKPSDGTPRPKAAPAVPSFLSSTLPAKPPTVESGGVGHDPTRKKKRRKHNLLGLTPKGEDHEGSEEEEVDEEASFASNAKAMEQQLQFEYKGQTSTLGSAAEICAWIEERKKRFPTKKRVEEKKAERERRVQEAQRIRTEALRAKNKSKQSERAGASVAEASGETKRIKGAAGADAAREKREKLRKKLKKQKRQLAKLDAELAKTDESKDAEPEASRRKRKHEEEINGVDEGKKQSGATQEDEEKIGEEDNPTPSLILSPPEMTSKPPEPEVETQAVEKMDESVSMSSGVSISSLTDSEDETSSSDASSSSPSSSSDDEAPDESSTRRTGPDKAAVRQGEKSGQICRRFLQTGRCSYSEKRGGCRFLHELPKHHSKGQGQRDSTIGDESGTARQAGKKGTRVKQQRKSLYQRMLENDREKEDTLVVRAIRHLAEHGLLDEPEPDAEGDVAVEGS